MTCTLEFLIPVLIMIPVLIGIYFVYDYYINSYIFGLIPASWKAYIDPIVPKASKKVAYTGLIMYYLNTGTGMMFISFWSQSTWTEYFKIVIIQ